MSVRFGQRRVALFQQVRVVVGPLPEVPPFAAMEFAACSRPWLKKVLSNIPAIRYGANCWPVCNLLAKKNEKTIHNTKLVSIGFKRVQPIPITLRL